MLDMVFDLLIPARFFTTWSEGRVVVVLHCEFECRAAMIGLAVAYATTEPQAYHTLLL
jgi:hypothetical protein